MSNASLLPLSIEMPQNQQYPRLGSRMALTDLTVDIPSFSRSPSATDEPRPAARWNTLEFKFYYVVAIVVIPLMVWIPITLSFPSHPNYPLYRAKLSSGWLFGRDIDNSDAQYRSFRNNLPILIVVATLCLIMKFFRVSATSHRPSSNLYMIPMNVAFSILMLIGLHGTSLIKILVILVLNYTIAIVCRGSKFAPTLTWVFNGGVLFLNEVYHGYQFADMVPALEFLDNSFKGFMPRWHIMFNISMLRLVSFNMDYYWACKQANQPEVDSGKGMTEKQRQMIAHPVEMYSFINYLSYVLYLPLYIAGPIITFNDFIWQHRRPLTIPTNAIIRYFIRFSISFFTMEFILHFMYMVAIKDRKAWEGDSPLEISLIGFWNLIIVWLKLLLPWRFFRLWALMDGIDPPENMVRCMVNNYSTLGFWRSWHRSYNLWITRYIYIPLGGAKNKIVNTVLVFSFVALWHDLTFKLLAWGWLVSLFIVPEIAARIFLSPSKYGSNPWYRHVCAIGAGLNMLMMMAANLVGFVIGTDGLKFFVSQLFGTLAGLRYLVFAFSVMFIGAQFMFEYREEEMRNGIYRKC